jgi:hypothetical protein
MMVRTFFLCLLATSSSYAFATQQRPAFSAKSVALTMVGGDAPPPLKVRIRVSQGKETYG